MDTQTETQSEVAMLGFLLTTRRNIYYYRRRIPLNIRYKYFTTDDILKSLRIKPDGSAKTERAALDAGKILDVKVSQVFNDCLRPDQSDEWKRTQISLHIYPTTVKKKLPIHIPPLVPKIRLRDICDDHIKRHRVFKIWRPATDDDVVTACDRACEILDNPIFDEMTTAHIDYLIEILSKMPTHRTNSPLYRDKTLQQVLDDIEALPADKKPKTLATRTIKKDLVWIKDILVDADKGHLFRMAALPVIDAMTGSPRIPFELSEIQQLINLLCWNPKYPVRFWAPLMGICHGLRANEVCQLRADEIFVFEGEPIIKISFENDTGRNVKGKIIRDLPLHPFLVELGLVKYAQMIREAGHTQLFPQIKLRKKGSSYSHDYTNWSARPIGGFVRKVTKDKRKTLHSFRHNFSTYLMGLSDVKGHFVSFLVGHSNSESMDKDEKVSTTLKIYTHSNNFKKLKEVLGKLYINQLDWRSVKSEINKIEGLDKIIIAPVELEVPKELKMISSELAGRFMKDFKF